MNGPNEPSYPVPPPSQVEERQLPGQLIEGPTDG